MTDTEKITERCMTCKHYKMATNTCKITKVMHSPDMMVCPKWEVKNDRQRENHRDDKTNRK